MSNDTLSDGSPERWNQLVIGGSRGRIRLQGDSLAYLFVSAYNGELLVYKTPKHLSTHEQEIFDEYGFGQRTTLNIDSILVARRAMSRFQFKLADSATLMLNGIIDRDSVSITAKKRSVEMKDFRLIKNGFHWVTE